MSEPPPVSSMEDQQKSNPGCMEFWFHILYTRNGCIGQKAKFFSLGNWDWCIRNISSTITTMEREKCLLFFFWYQRHMFNEGSICRLRVDHSVPQTPHHAFAVKRVNNFPLMDYYSVMSSHAVGYWPLMGEVHGRQIFQKLPIGTPYNADLWRMEEFPGKKITKCLFLSCSNTQASTTGHCKWQTGHLPWAGKTLLQPS